MSQWYQLFLPDCELLPCHMVSMDTVATHHAVLGISIFPDPATVRSYCNGITVTLDRLRRNVRVRQTVLEGCARLPCHMMSMDIVATHHAVLGISILPDPATVRSCCNGLTVTLDRLRTLCVKQEGVSVKPFWRVVSCSPAIW